MDENTPCTPPQTPLPTGNDPAPKSKEENTLGLVCHLLGFAILVVPFVGQIIGPLVLWLVKRAESPYLDAVGKEVVNFNISWTIYAAILFFSIVGWLILPVIGIVWLVLVILAAIKASEGKFYRYPLTIRMIK